MRCSICNATDPVFIFGHYHCGYCADIIRQTIGDLNEKDIEDIILGDEQIDELIRELEDYE